MPSLTLNVIVIAFLRSKHFQTNEAIVESLYQESNYFQEHFLLKSPEVVVKNFEGMQSKTFNWLMKRDRFRLHNMTNEIIAFECLNRFLLKVTN